MPTHIFLFRRCFLIKAELLINDEIQAQEVRLVGADGEKIGVMPLAQAKEVAEKADLDLVMIAPEGKPPVCRVMDYSKYRFEQTKREKEARHNQKTITVKEVRFSPVIEEHDLAVRIKNARKFLSEEDNKVKVSVYFRGRQMAHTEIGYTILARISTELEDLAVVERKPLMEGRNMTMLLGPKKNK